MTITLTPTKAQVRAVVNLQVSRDFEKWVSRKPLLLHKADGTTVAEGSMLVEWIDNQGRHMQATITPEGALTHEREIWI